MPESRELSAARVCLAEAETSLASADGLARLTDGLERLDDILETGSKAEARTAGNLAASYAAVFMPASAIGSSATPRCRSRSSSIGSRSCWRSTRSKTPCPAAAAELKIGVVRALIERYYEGHPPEKKRAVLEQLAALRRS